MRVPLSKEEFRRRVDFLLLAFEGSETSGRRTPKRNVGVGGSPDSKHPYGMAVDVVLDDMRNRHRTYFVAAAKRLGLWAVDEGDHVHLQGWPPGPVDDAWLLA